MYIAILGRQPALGIAELERVFTNTKWFSDSTATFEADYPVIERLGGSQKAGRVVIDVARGDWRTVSMKIVRHYQTAWAASDTKMTLGISAYGFDRFEVTPRDVQKTGLVLKSKLKASGVSLRLVPNTDPSLNTAVSHHNKLGLSANKVELLVVKSNDGRIIVAESIGAQNITALAARDQGRPKRDAFVGMLPPKLAQIMINLASSQRFTGQVANKHLQPKFVEAPGSSPERGAKPFASDVNGESSPRLLDPFCGTGVILQEAALLGYSVYGTDLSDKMISFSRINLDWLQDTIMHKEIDYTVHEGDATDTKWQQPLDLVVGETYLGQPFSAPPSPSKLTEVRGNCNHIITTFLKNIAPQLQSGTPLCLAVPAWRGTDGHFTHLPLINKLPDLGFELVQFTNIAASQLLYYREDQVVARELLVLVRK